MVQTHFPDSTYFAVPVARLAGIKRIVRTRRDLGYWVRPVDRWLATQPKPFAVAEVPVGPTTRYHSTYMLHSMAHWQKTVHGHSSLLPALHERLYDQLRNFPDEASLQTLSDIGVDYIVVHLDMYPPGEWSDVEYRLAQYAARLVPQYADATGRVYRLQ
jgi:hypothetical protein